MLLLLLLMLLVLLLPELYDLVRIAHRLQHAQAGAGPHVGGETHLDAERERAL